MDSLSLPASVLCFSFLFGIRKENSWHNPIIAFRPNSAIYQFINLDLCNIEMFSFFFFGFHSDGSALPNNRLRFCFIWKKIQENQNSLFFIIYIIFFSAAGLAFLVGSTLRYLDTNMVYIIFFFFILVQFNKHRKHKMDRKKQERDRS